MNCPVYWLKLKSNDFDADMSLFNESKRVNDVILQYEGFELTTKEDAINTE